MREPVLSTDKYVYEKDAFEQYILENNVSPVT